MNGVWHIFRFECLLPFRNLPFSSQQLFLLWFLLLNPQSNHTAFFHCTLCPASHVSWGVVTWGKMRVKCGVHLVFSHLSDINPLVSTYFCLLSYTFKHLFIFNLVFMYCQQKRWFVINFLFPKREQICHLLITLEISHWWYLSVFQVLYYIHEKWW